MLLIAGGGEFIVRLEGKTGLAWIDWLSGQLTHPAWNGFTFYDFIFPLFLFISGVSVCFSIGKSKSLGIADSSIYQKAFKRMIVLILLGIVYKNAPVPVWEPSQIRYGSVLGRIGIATFFTTLLLVHFSWRQRLYWVAGILLVYFAALLLIPVPGFGAGDLSFEGNLVGWVDRTILPGILKQGIYDELGLLTQLPAMCLTILGAWAGELLRDSKIKSKTLSLMLVGLVCLGLGLFWSMYFPINKHLWSSSFILLTAGMAFIFLAAFYWIIDVKGYRKWSFFFKVIGMNSLLVYYLYRFINFNYTSELIFGGLYAVTPEIWHSVFQAVGAVALVWLFLYLMYRNKIFVKI
ncbi:MAG: DUF5009 domain-containing protein [Cyclobacteriaceae bacterium]|nr:MAG: DUF5009 domain-containing protein [Cyclobacteriaceae bacterium]